MFVKYESTMVNDDNIATNSDDNDTMMIKSIENVFGVFSKQQKHFEMVFISFLHFVRAFWMCILCVCVLSQTKKKW